MSNTSTSSDSPLRKLLEQMKVTIGGFADVQLVIELEEMVNDPTFDEGDPAHLAQFLEQLEVYQIKKAREIQETDARTRLLEGQLVESQSKLKEMELQAENENLMADVHEERRLREEVQTSRQALKDLTEDCKSLEQDVLYLQQRATELERLNDELADEQAFFQCKLNELEKILTLGSKIEIREYLQGKAAEMDQLTTEVRELDSQLAESRRKLSKLQDDREVQQAKVVELSHVYSLTQGGGGASASGGRQKQQDSYGGRPPTIDEHSTSQSTPNQESLEEEHASLAQVSLTEGEVLTDDQALELMVLKLRKKVDGLEAEKAEYQEMIVNLQDDVSCLSVENDARTGTIKELEKHLKQLQQAERRQSWLTWKSKPDDKAATDNKNKSGHDSDENQHGGEEENGDNSEAKQQQKQRRNSSWLPVPTVGWKMKRGSTMSELATDDIPEAAKDDKDTKESDTDPDTGSEEDQKPKASKATKASWFGFRRSKSKGGEKKDAALKDDHNKDANDGDDEATAASNMDDDEVASSAGGSIWSGVQRSGVDDDELSQGETSNDADEDDEDDADDDADEGDQKESAKGGKGKARRNIFSSAGKKRSSNKRRARLRKPWEKKKDEVEVEVEHDDDDESLTWQKDY